MELVDVNKIQDICKKHRVSSMYLFGSATGHLFTQNSDIDLLVSFELFDLSEYFTNYISLKSALEKLIGRKVDLVEQQTLKNPILIRSINKNKELIYGRESLEIAP